MLEHHDRAAINRFASVSLLLFLQVYYELAAERAKQGKEKEIAIARIEQLAPFPYDLVTRELRRYPNAEVGCPS